MLGGVKTHCKQCKCTFEAKGRRGPTPKYCGDVCRKKASLKRIARRKQVPTLPRWVYAQRRWAVADGKRPVQPGRQAASTINPSTWVDYADVVGGGPYGVMLGGGLGCMDIDDCIHGGRVDAWACEFIAALDDVLAVEVSVSGRGLHVFLAHGEAPGRRVRLSGGHGYELYSRDRFIRTTEDFIKIESGGRIARTCSEEK